MKSPIQQMFEQMAQDIMKKYQRDINNTTVEWYRLEKIKAMNKELLALKESYEGLLSGPVMDCPFAENLGLEFTKA